MADENETETESTTPLAEMEIDRHDEEFELSFHDEEDNIGDEIPVLEGSFVEVDGEGEMTQSTSAYACLKCKKTYKNEKNLKTHLKVHSETSVKCLKCPRPYESGQQLERHMLKLHSLVCMCELCGIECRTRKALNNHKMTKHNADGKAKIVCPYPDCSKVFVKKTVFNHHINSHLKNKPFTCKTCDKKFLGKYERNRHLISCGKLTDLICCKVCGRNFSCRSNLNIHTASVHKQKLYECGACGKSYKYITGLLKHMKKKNHQIVA